MRAVAGTELLGKRAGLGSGHTIVRSKRVWMVYPFVFLTMGCSPHRWAAKSSSRFNSYFCFISSSDLPSGGPEGLADVALLPAFALFHRQEIANGIGSLFRKHLVHGIAAHAIGVAFDGELQIRVSKNDSGYFG